MPRVLLVEDEPAIADTLLYALETECFSVTHALTGTDALVAFDADPHDFAILDIGLPDMTGLDVCRRLREKSSIPILFLTARDSEIDQVLGLEPQVLARDAQYNMHLSVLAVVNRVSSSLPL